MRRVDWIKLPQDRGKQQAVVNTVWNFRFHKMLGISWLGEELLVSLEEL